MRIPNLKWPARDGDYDDDLLLDVEACVIAYLHRGRNAWHSTWVRHRFHNTQLFGDVWSAMLGAESLRERGNVFYIRNIPALLLRGPHEAVILCEPRDYSPFREFAGFQTEPVESAAGRWIGGIFPGVSLRDAIAAFSPASGNWRGTEKYEDTILTGMIPAEGELEAWDGEFRSYSSFAQGSEQLLGWLADRSQRLPSMEGVDAIEARWRELSAVAVSSASPDADRATAFAEYRDNKLNAEPHSLWQARVDAARASAKAAEDALRQAWADARSRHAELKIQLLNAESELKAAKDACLHPADTSAGVRAQRERVSNAERVLSGLRSDVAFISAAENARKKEWLGGNSEMWTSPVDPHSR